MAKPNRKQRRKAERELIRKYGRAKLKRMDLAFMFSIVCLYALSLAAIYHGCDR